MSFGTTHEAFQLRCKISFSFNLGQHLFVLKLFFVLVSSKWLQWLRIIDIGVYLCLWGWKRIEFPIVEFWVFCLSDLLCKLSIYRSIGSFVCRIGHLWISVHLPVCFDGKGDGLCVVLFDLCYWLESCNAYNRNKSNLCWYGIIHIVYTYIINLYKFNRCSLALSSRRN